MTASPAPPGPSSWIRRVRDLAREREAVLLAHNYQRPEVQEAADFVGDSLELSRKAAGVEGRVIVFCGVRFMAETAALLAPDKTVLLPDEGAGCPMADMLEAEDLVEWKKQYPGRPVVLYVNTSAAAKAEADLCCTSANADAVVASLPEEEILFGPDKNLAAWTQRRTAKRIIAWDGWCHVHQGILPRDVAAARTRHPGAVLWAHPECRPEVLDLADRVLSTGGMVREAAASAAADVIIATECGMLHRLRRDHPDKRFFPVKENALCPNMKKVTLPKIAAALETMAPRVTVPPEIAARARRAIERMIRL
ncbi:MAG: quinolinate synthase NadA [Acidobacteriota bacterium]|nr:quinolinate synthase NadA [Acidobacteriota bacterium]MDD8028724.1 quinolinate synthase NadA [Acidobacteriota bacterium]MDD8032311.1 quinolinate synthase NadA [Acidobacteriota bacterium]MDD8038211.1 quinolinate synthase NadA [Acidobacteriota bacterium]